MGQTRYFERKAGEVDAMGWFWPRKDIAAPQPREEKVRSMGWGLALFVSLFAILSAREEDDDAEAPMRRERRKRN